MAKRWRSFQREFLVRKYLKYLLGSSMLRISSMSLTKYLGVMISFWLCSALQRAFDVPELLHVGRIDGVRRKGRPAASEHGCVWCSEG